MTNAEYERLYAVGDILRYLRKAEWRMRMLVDAGDPVESPQLDKVDDALNGIRDTFNNLEIVNRKDR